jgi:hypothetical protein
LNERASIEQAQVQFKAELDVARVRLRNPAVWSPLKRDCNGSGPPRIAFDAGVSHSVAVAFLNAAATRPLHSYN